MPKKILFEPWKDPLSTKDPSEIDGECFALPDDFEANRSLFRKQDNVVKYDGRIFLSPIGILPLGDHNLPSETFNMWVMHTNFVVTPNIADLIESVPGVESLMIFSPYRLWIGIGRLFDTQEVQENLRQELCSEFSPQAIQTIRNQALRKGFQYWAIVSQRGRLNLVGGESQLGVMEKLQPNMRIIDTSWTKS